MFSFSTQNFVLTIVGSLLIILAGHYLWNYLRDHYTEKKTKDLVHGQVEKYKRIVAELQASAASGSQNSAFLDASETAQLGDDLAAFANSLE
jgi:hypothetical protein